MNEIHDIIYKLSDKALLKYLDFVIGKAEAQIKTYPDLYFINKNNYKEKAKYLLLIISSLDIELGLTLKNRLIENETELLESDSETEFDIEIYAALISKISKVYEYVNKDLNIPPEPLDAAPPPNMPEDESPSPVPPPPPPPPPIIEIEEIMKTAEPHSIEEESVIDIEIKDSMKPKSNPTRPPKSDSKKGKLPPKEEAEEITKPSSSDIGLGNIDYEVPTEMLKGESTLARVRIAQADVEKEVLKISPKSIGENIKVTELMVVDLVDPSDGENFDIDAISSLEQLILPGDYTEWTFSVKALKTGTYSLFLKVSIKIISERFGERKKDITVLKREIKVENKEIIKKENTMDFKQIKKLIQSNKTKQAINALLEIGNEDDDFHNQIVLLSARFNGVEKDKNLGLLSNEQSTRTLAQINYALLQIIDDV